MATEDLVIAAKAILAEKAVIRFDEPIELASGLLSSVFVDGKAGLAEAADLRVACQAMAALIADAGIEFDAIGGLTLGADHLAVGVALCTDRRWFFVRKEPKGRGTGKQIEGATLGPGVRVLVVEDAVSTGGSMTKAIDIVAATGADVVAAATLIDRGDVFATTMADRGIAYFTLATYADLGLEPVGASA